MQLYFRYFSIHLKSLMQYKASFAMSAVGQFLGALCDFLGVWFMMSRFHTVEGFTTPEVLLCYAVVLTAFALSECFARGFDMFSSLLGNGEFDRMLLRPASPVFQVIASRIEFSRLGRLLQALIILIVAMRTSDVVWAADKLAVLLLMIVCGALFFSALFIFGASVCFFTTEGLELLNIFTDGGREFGMYPVSVYGKGLLRFYTFVIPLALFQYYPLLVLTGRSASPLYAVAPLLSLLFLLPAALVWRIGLKHYKSTGS